MKTTSAVPKGKHSLHALIAADLFKRAQRRAKQIGVSTTAVVKMALNDYLEGEKNGTPRKNSQPARSTHRRRAGGKSRSR